MRTPARHLVLLLTAALGAIAVVAATQPGTGRAPLTGAYPVPPPAERAGRPATPAPAPLCSARLAPRHHGDETTGAPAPAPVLSVPILAYHYVRNDNTPSDVLGRRLSVTPGDFAAQMDLLERAGVHTITLADLLAAMAGQVQLPPHPVVLTFDDGHADFATNALPVLQRHRFCATAFVVPNFLGRPAYLTTGQLRTVAAAGIRIGAHTMDHLDLTHQPPPVVTDQVSRSGDVLRALTGQPVRDFAYPYGLFDSTAIAAVQAAGFDDAVALAATLPETPGARFTLPREEVIGGESLASFAAQAGLPPPGGNGPH